MTTPNTTLPTRTSVIRALLAYRWLTPTIQLAALGVAFVFTVTNTFGFVSGGLMVVFLFFAGYFPLDHKNYEALATTFTCRRIPMRRLEEANAAITLAVPFLGAALALVAYFTWPDPHPVAWTELHSQCIGLPLLSILGHTYHLRRGHWQHFSLTNTAMITGLLFTAWLCVNIVSSVHWSGLIIAAVSTIGAISYLHATIRRKAT